MDARKGGKRGQKKTHMELNPKVRFFCINLLHIDR